MSASKFEGLNRKQRRQDLQNLLQTLEAKHARQGPPDLEATTIYLPSVQNASSKWIDPNVMGIMMAYKDIPAQYHSLPYLDTDSGTAKTPREYQHMLSKWFYGGLTILEPKLKSSVVLAKDESFIRHVGTILQSWDPRHEHKFSYLTYLLDKCCEEIVWSSK